MTSILVEIAGWIGALMILAAYALLTAGKVNAKSATYQMMNVVGAAGFIINGWWHGAIPSTALNVIWLLIGAIASWRILTKKESSTSAM